MLRLASASGCENPQTADQKRKARAMKKKLKEVVYQGSLHCDGSRQHKTGGEMTATTTSCVSNNKREKKRRDTTRTTRQMAPTVPSSSCDCCCGWRCQKVLALMTCEHLETTYFLYVKADSTYSIYASQNQRGSWKRTHVSVQARVHYRNHQSYPTPLSHYFFTSREVVGLQCSCLCPSSRSCSLRANRKNSSASRSSATTTN